MTTAPTAAATALLSILAALPTATAQTNRTLIDRNVSYTVGPVPTTPADSVDCDFTADSRFAPDVLEEHWWWFRFAGDPDEKPFYDDGSMTTTFEPSRATFEWADLDGRGLLTARLSIEVLSTGLDSGRVVSRLTLNNLTNQPVAVTIFHYADIDTCDPIGDSAVGRGDDHLVVGACSQQQVRVNATLVDHWAVASSSSSELGLMTPGAVTLSDSQLPLVSSNYSGALQWRRVVAADLPEVIVTRLTHISGPCGAAASLNYGTGQGGSLGAPVLTTDALPRLDTTAALRLSNAAPSAPVFYLFGFDRANEPYANLTLLVQVGPRGAQFDFVPSRTDATGNDRIPFAVPPLLSLCGEQLYWQAFVADSTVPGALKIAHTDAVQWQLGR